MFGESDASLTPFRRAGAVLMLCAFSAASSKDTSTHTLSTEDFTKAGMVYIDGQVFQPLVDTTYLSARTEYYADLVETMASAAFASDLFSTCDYYDQCRTTPGVSNESYVHFPNVGIAVNESIIATKLVEGQYPYADDTYADDASVLLNMNDVCYGNDKLADFQSNLASDTYGALTWQYIGFRDQGTYSIYPFSVKADCEDGYDPRLRPWYVSAVTGPINMWILIDITEHNAATAAKRVNSEIAAARKLLRSLSYWSFFNIGVYSSTARFYSTTLTRASSDNLDAANAFLDSLDASDSEFSNLKNMFDLLQSSLADSEASGSTSYCHNIVTVLAGQANSFKWISPEKDVENLVVLSYVFNFDAEPVDKVYKQLACATSGQVTVMTDENAVSTANTIVESFSDYCAIAIDNTLPRYSEIYTDAFGLGNVITAAAPLYTVVNYDVTNEFNETYSAGLTNLVGVYGVDIRISDINNNGAISNDEIMAFLASSLACPAIQYSDGALDFLRGGDTCLTKTDSNEASGTLDLEKKHGMYQAIGALVFLGLLAIIGGGYMCIIKKKGSAYSDTEKIALAFTVIVFLAFGGGLLGFILEVSWHDIVVHHEYTATKGTVMETFVDPYGCCQVKNCQCSEYGGETCAYNKQNLIEGACSDGYKCCETYCYDCNCHYNSQTRRNECQRCCDCTSEVYNQACETNCGTCYDLLSLIEYQPDEDPDLDVIVTKSGSCEMDDDACATKFTTNNPVGKTVDLWYNPTDYTEVEYDNSYKSNFYPTVVSLAIFWALPIVLFFILVIKYCVSPKRTSVTDSKVVPMAPMITPGPAPVPGAVGSVSVQMIPVQGVPQPQAYGQTVSMNNGAQPMTQSHQGYVQVSPQPGYAPQQMQMAPQQGGGGGGYMQPQQGYVQPQQGGGGYMQPQQGYAQPQQGGGSYMQPQQGYAQPQQGGGGYMQPQQGYAQPQQGGGGYMQPQQGYAQPQ